MELPEIEPRHSEINRTQNNNFTINIQADKKDNAETISQKVMNRVSDKPYKIKYEVFDDIHKIANVEKKIPLEWIDVENNSVRQELIDYIKPLIQGEVKQIYKDGLPQHITLK